MNRVFPEADWPDAWRLSYSYDRMEQFLQRAPGPIARRLMVHMAVLFQKPVEVAPSRLMARELAHPAQLGKHLHVEHHDEERGQPAKDDGRHEAERASRET